MLALQTVQEAAHVARGALGPGGARMLEVGVERGKGEPAETLDLAARVLALDDLGLGLLIFQLDVVAHQIDDRAL